MTTTINGSSPSITFSDGSAQTSATRPFQNRLINGAMVIDQRNAGASVTATTANEYTLDRWFQRSSTSSKFTVQQNAGSVTPPIGFSYYLGVTSSSSYSSSASDYFFLNQNIEGFNTADLGWGTANAKTVTLSFWVRSSLTGNFGGSLRNSDANYSYPFTYTISAANTWEQKSVTIAGPTSGTWVGATNGIGITVCINLGTGTTFSGTAGSWASANYVSTTGSVAVTGTSGATFYITGVQLEVGNNATSFDYRPYTTELQLCQRYYAKMGAGGYSSYTALASGLATASTSGNLYVKYPVTMRASATIAYSNVAYSYAAGSITAISSAGSTYAGTDSMLAAPTASGASMTIGYACVLLANNNSAGYIELSAEL